MAAGHIVSSQCVDVAASADHYFSQLLPSVSPGTSTFQTQAEKLSGSWYLTTYQDGAAISQTLLTVPAFSSCDTTEKFYDGMAIGWGVAAAIIAAWAIKNLRRSL